MSLFLSVHAVKRMHARGISREEIEEVLASDGSTRYVSHDSADCTVVLGETIAGRRLKVVVETFNHDVIITVAGRDEEEYRQ